LIRARPRAIIVDLTYSFGMVHSSWFNRSYFLSCLVSLSFQSGLLKRKGWDRSLPPPGYFSVKGRCPDEDGEEGCDFLVSRSYVDRWQRVGPGWKFYNFHVIPEVLANPSVILGGLKREGHSHGFCYSGRVSKQMQNAEIELPPPPDRVGVVIVCPDHRGNVVLDYEWRQEDPDRPGWPQSWLRDFVRPIWTT